MKAVATKKSSKRKPLRDDPVVRGVTLIIEILQHTPFGAKDAGGSGYRILRDGSFEGFEPEGHTWTCGFDEFESNVDVEDLKGAVDELLSEGHTWPRCDIPDELRGRAEKFRDKNE